MAKKKKNRKNSKKNNTVQNNLKNNLSENKDLGTKNQEEVATKTVEIEQQEDTVTSENKDLGTKNQEEVVTKTVEIEQQEDTVTSEDKDIEIKNQEEVAIKTVETEQQEEQEEAIIQENNENSYNEESAKLNLDHTSKKSNIINISKTKFIAYLAISSIISSLITYNLTKPAHINTDTIITTTTEVDISSIMSKLENNKLIKINPTYSLDYSFDSTFDNIKEEALAIETRVLNSKENLQEIFIIQSTNPKNIELELKMYKESLVELYKSKSDKKEELNIAKNIIIDSYNDITYFIAAKNGKDIKNFIETELKQ